MTQTNFKSKRAFKSAETICDEATKTLKSKWVNVLRHRDFGGGIVTESPVAYSKQLGRVKMVYHIGGWGTFGFYSLFEDECFAELSKEEMQELLTDGHYLRDKRVNGTRRITAMSVGEHNFCKCYESEIDDLWHSDEVLEFVKGKFAAAKVEWL
ncbi:MAG: hypothetical protein LUI09_01740 [Prevotellaceae bacterium]|nr:hypothetical protein [Prevotellaceae bacterium]